MNSSLVQLLVLAAVAIFLIIKLRSVLGTRDGFEKPQASDETLRPRAERQGANLSVVEGGLDRDIVDHVPSGSPEAEALARMKALEPSFSLSEFLAGAKGAYEMILMAFERGDLSSVRAFISDEVADSLGAAIAEREAQGLKIDANFVGLREILVTDATFDDATKTADITVRFLGELTSVVRNQAGEIVEGSPTEIKRQRDVWTFARQMGSNNPNWQLVATSE